MAASQAAILAGKGYVSLFIDSSKLNAGLAAASARLQAMGSSVMATGRQMVGVGLAMGAPIVAALGIFGDYEQALADLRAGANPTAAEFERIKEQIEAISKATGISPVEVAAAYTELVKAGISVESVLGGIGELSLKFARVSGMEMAATAQVLVNAMNTFSREGVSAADLANIMSQGADSSTLSLRDMAEGFGTVGGVMANFGFTARDTATAIAMVGKFGGVTGSEAATQLKTFLMGLTETSGSTADAMRELGFVFRDGSGNMLPMVEIIGNLQTSFARFGQADRDRLLTMLGGLRGSRGIAAMLTGGVAGWNELSAAMQGNMSVEEKFNVMTDTLWGTLKKVWVHIQFVAIAVGDALAPALRVASAIIMPFLDGLQRFIQDDKALVQYLAFDAVKALVFGGALIGVAVAINLVAAGLGVLATAAGIFGAVFAGLLATVGFLFSPAGLLVAGIATAVYFADDLAAMLGKVGSFLGSVWSAVKGFADDSGISAVLGDILRITVGVAAAIAGVIGLAGYLAYLGVSSIPFARIWERLTEMFSGDGNFIARMTLAIRMFLTDWSSLISKVLWPLQQIGDVVLGIGKHFSAVGESIASTFGDAVNTTMTQVGNLVSNFTDNFGQAWRQIQDAFGAGRWDLIFESLALAGERAWFDISNVASEVYHSWKFAFVDAFESIWLAVQNSFDDIWSEIQASAFEGLAAIVRRMADADPTGALFGDRLQERADQLSNLGAETRNEARRAIGERTAGAEIAANMRYLDEVSRQGEALREWEAGAQDLGMRLGDLDNRIEAARVDADFWRQYNEVMQGSGTPSGTLRAPGVGDGSPGSREGAAIGSFSHDALMGFSGRSDPQQQLVRQGERLIDIEQNMLAVLERLNERRLVVGA